MLSRVHRQRGASTLLAALVQGWQAVLSLGLAFLPRSRSPVSSPSLLDKTLLGY